VNGEAGKLKSIKGCVKYDEIETGFFAQIKGSRFNSIMIAAAAGNLIWC
jgi:hypothetical protein